MSKRHIRIETSKVDRLEQWLPITFILLIATILRFYQLDTESLWIDEFYSIRDAHALEIHFRVLYPLILRFWMILGTSDAWLRGLSVFFGIGCVLLVYLLGRRLSGEKAGIVSALLVALSPLFINHSQEVRMYMLGTLLSLCGTLALAHALERPTHTAINCWAGARLLGLYTFPLTVTLFLADVLLIGLTFRRQHRVLLAFGVRLVLIGILWFPVIPHVVRSALGAGTPGWDWTDTNPPPLLQKIPSKLVNFTAHDQLGTLSPYGLRFYQIYCVILLFLLVIAILKKRQKAKVFWLSAWAMIPFVTILAFCYIAVSIWIPRYLLFASPYILILLAIGFLRVWRWRRMVALAITVVHLAAVCGGLARYYTKLDRSDWRSLVATLSARERPGDVIVTATSMDEMKPVFAHAYQGACSIRHLRLPVQEVIMDNRVRRQTDSNQIVEELTNIQNRTWLVYWRNNLIDSQAYHRSVKNRVGERFDIEDHAIFKSDNGHTEIVDLFLLGPRAGN